VSWIDVIGWGGSALLIFSLLQARVFRFRVLNLMASLVLTVFNVALEIWPLPHQLLLERAEGLRILQTDRRGILRRLGAVRLEPVPKLGNAVVHG
jgi:hypothetical protein